jgi:hypothetical protein
MLTELSPTGAGHGRTDVNLKFVSSCRSDVDIPIPRCTLRGAHIGALHADSVEADTSSHNIAPTRELSVSVGGLTRSRLG